MFSQGGLHIGPTTGNIQQDPSVLIGEGALSIAQVNQLQGRIDSKASLAQLNTGLAGKEPTIAEGFLAPSRVANLVRDLASKASTQQLVDAVDTLNAAIAMRQAQLTTESAPAVDTITARVRFGDAFRFLTPTRRLRC